MSFQSLGHFILGVIAADLTALPWIHKQYISFIIYIKIKESKPEQQQDGDVEAVVKPKADNATITIEKEETYSAYSAFSYPCKNTFFTIKNVW